MSLFALKKHKRSRKAAIKRSKVLAVKLFLSKVDTLLFTAFLITGKKDISSSTMMLATFRIQIAVNKKIQ
jgi:hypothetical protein